MQKVHKPMGIEAADLKGESARDRQEKRRRKMIAELGNYALALSLAVSLMLAIFPLWGLKRAMHN